MFSSNRTFSIYSYAVSHGLLLLRSGKTKAHPTRLDILFQDVRAMEVRCWFDGLEISEASPEILKGFASDPTVLLEHGNKVYQLKGNGWSGYVLGGIMRTNEDDREFNEPSPVIEKI